MPSDTDFSGKTVLVVGGSSGIGNGIAQGFRTRGAQVHVWGTRADPAAYSAADGSDLAGLGYTDDAAVFTALMAVVGRNLKPRHKAAAKADIERLRRD